MDKQATMRTFDQWQLEALEECLSGHSVSVVGAPGTGKTTVLVEAAARLSEAGKKVAVLTLDRRAASAIQGELTLRLGSLSERTQVRSLAGFAYHIAQTFAQMKERKQPELISGPDEDSLIAEILAEPGAEISFPSYVDADLRKQRGFRAQMRDLITRASELGVAPAGLRELGRSYEEPMWVAGADLMELYEAVTLAADSFGGKGAGADRFDHARLVGAVTAFLANWEDGEGGYPRPRWDAVFVDDIQNAPRSILGLLAQLASDGASIIVAGNPDAAVQGFRGGVASLPGDVCAPRPQGVGCSQVALRQRHRGGKVLAEIANRVASATRVGGGVIAHRLPESGEAKESIEAKSFVHAEEEAAYIAFALRRVHLIDGMAYSQMAVMTRSRSMHAGLRDSLVRRGVPVGQIGSDVPLREEPAVAALIDLVKVSCIPGATAEDVRRVLTGPLVGIDPMVVRRCLRIARGYEIKNHGARSEKELTLAVLSGISELEELAPRGVEPLIAAGKIIERIRSRAKSSQRQAEDVLWEAWESCGQSSRWQEAALGQGSEADAANKNLDAVIQLFRVAQRLADRDPRVTIEELLRELEAHDLPQDSIARAGIQADAVTLVTPNASLGRQWDFVVVAGMQDGLWPNVRVRDALTHTNRLAQILTGRDPGVDPHAIRSEAFNDVIDDELRQLQHALGRASERLLLTCVDSDDAQPSRFFDLMGFVPEDEEEGREAQDPADREQTEGFKETEGLKETEAFKATRAENSWAYERTLAGGRLVREKPRPLPAAQDALGLVSQLRRCVELGGEEAGQAQELLERLAVEGFSEARSDSWIVGLEWGSSEGTALSDPIYVSPSRVERLLDCPLRAFLESIGASDTDSRTAAELGTFIHSLAERHATAEPQEIREAFEREWPLFPKPEEELAERALYTKARNLVEGLILYLRNAREEGARAEVEFGFKEEVGDQVWLTGKIDRIETTEVGTRIVDFKTGKSITKAEGETHVQMQLYQWALEKTRDDLRGAALVYVAEVLKRENRPKEILQSPLNEETRLQAEDRISTAARLLRSGELPANPQSPSCRHCAFTIMCPAQPEGRIFS